MESNCWSGGVFSFQTEIVKMFSCVTTVDHNVHRPSRHDLPESTSLNSLPGLTDQPRSAGPRLAADVSHDWDWFSPFCAKNTSYIDFP